MNGKSLVIMVGAVVVLVGGYLLLRGDQSAQPQVSMSPEVSPKASTSPSVTPSPTSTPTVSGAAKGPVKTFAVKGLNFSYDLKEIKVNKGDTVKIVFTNTEGLHDWVIDQFNARTPRVQVGQSSTIEFVADKTGTFQYYCSVGSHRAQGMRGNLIVQ